MSAVTGMQSTLHSTDTTRAVMEQKKEEAHEKPVKRGPSRADQQAELFTELMFGGHTYTADQMATKLARLMKLSDVKSAPVTADQMSLLYDYYGSVNSRCDTLRMGFGDLLTYLCDTLVYDPRLADVLPDSIQTQAKDIHSQIYNGLGQLRQPNYSLLVVLSTLPPESPETYDFVDTLTAMADARMEHEHYYVGESVMYAEMRGGFDQAQGIYIAEQTQEHRDDDG